MADVKRRPKDLPLVTAPTVGDVLILDGASTRSIDIANLVNGGKINGVATICVDRATLKAIDPTISTVAILTEVNRVGQFLWRAGDYSAQITADTYEALYIKANSVAATAGAWVRPVTDGKYQVDWWRTVGATKTADTAAVKAAIESVPSGSELVFARFKQYDINEISATTQGHLHVNGNLALISNTTQIATSGVPILRVFARTQAFDVTIENLFIQGPRLTSSTTVGTGSYGGDPLNPGPGYPSGLDVPIGRTVILRNLSVTGTYFAGVEAHYCSHLIVDNVSVSNHGYAGIMWSDCAVTDATKFTVDDVGSVSPTDGYGISAATSYNGPGYAYGNGIVRISGGNVTRCKRKGIDVHSGLNCFVWENYTKGCGYGHIYAVCEGSDKQVANASIHDNHCEGDATFLSGACTDAVISVGLFGVTPTVIAQNTNMDVHNNRIVNLTSPNGIFFSNNDVAGKVGITSKAGGNVFSGCSFSGAAIGSNNYSKLLKMVSVSGNTIEATVGVAHIYIQDALDALSTGNICRNLGTPPTTVTTLFNVVTNGQRVNNMLDGVLGQ